MHIIQDTTRSHQDLILFLWWANSFIPHLSPVHIFFRIHPLYHPIYIRLDWNLKSETCCSIHCLKGSWKFHYYIYFKCLFQHFVFLSRLLNLFYVGIFKIILCNESNVTYTFILTKISKWRTNNCGEKYFKGKYNYHMMNNRVFYDHPNIRYTKTDSSRRFRFVLGVVRLSGTGVSRRRRRRKTREAKGFEWGYYIKLVVIYNRRQLYIHITQNHDS